MSGDRRRPFILVCGDYVKTGGQDVANFALADYLARNGRETHLVGYRFDPSLQGRPGLHLHRLPKVGNSYTVGAPFLTTAGLLQYVARFGARPHVVSNGGNCPSPSVNWVHYVHAAYEPSSGLARRRAVQAFTHPVSKVTERLAMRAARLVICNSERTRRDVIDRIGVPEARTKTVYYGMDPARFVPISKQAREKAASELGWPLDRFRVVFIGALGDSRKGFDALYDAWRIVSSRKGWDGELVVIGVGAELDMWRARARADGLENSIAFLGFRSDVPRVLAASDALVAPTRYEAYGLGVHEALCVGLPAIVSAGAGVAERYPSSLRELLVSDPNDSGEIAARLERVRTSGADMLPAVRALGDQLREWTWDDMAREITNTADARA